MLTIGEARNIIGELSLPKQDYDTKQRFNYLPNDKNRIVYSCQKEHWLVWLTSKEDEHDFKFVYNKLKCAPMLCWLAEALGIDTALAKNKMKMIFMNEDKTAIMREESHIFRLEVPYESILNIIEKNRSY